MKAIKNSLFQFFFVFNSNLISNQIVLLFIDLLELLTLPCLYLNPAYTHLKSHSLLDPYFTQVYPYFFHFRQNPDSEVFPVCITIFALCAVILFVIRKSKENIVNIIIGFIMTLGPFFSFRVISEAINFKQFSFAIFVFSTIVAILGFAAFGFVLLFYRKICKFLDIVAGILLFLDVNQYGIIAFLGVKIVLTAIIPFSTPAKSMKLCIQTGLYLSLLILVFVRAATQNYIMLACLMFLSLLYPGFNLFVELQYKDITKINYQQDDIYCTSNRYQMNQVLFFRKINKHIYFCANLECRCRQVVKIKGASQLKKWIPGYIKQLLKINAEKGQIVQRRFFEQSQFDKQIPYIKFCAESQTLDFEGFIKLHELKPKTLVQEYKKYEYLKKYMVALQKQNPKALKMNIVNEDEENSPFNDFLQLQNKISGLIKKVKQFWQFLKNNRSHQFVQLIQEIADDINQVNDLYGKIEMNYDEKDEADYYYSMFRLLTLHEKPHRSFFYQHHTNYIMVTKGQRIINTTTNASHLFERPLNRLIGNKYTSLMHSSYINDHTEWARNYLKDYKINQDVEFVKLITINQHIVKVVRMTHLLLPNFQLICDAQGENGQELGVNVVTFIRHKEKDSEECADKKEVAFHMLVSRQNLDIYAYQASLFQHFDESPSIENTNKLIRSNLKKLFPNLNKQALLSKNTGKILIAKENKDFFDSDDHEDRANPFLCYEATQTQKINKKQMQKNLQVSEVVSSKNKSLNLLLLCFQFQPQKDYDRQKSVKITEKDAQLQLFKEKTVKTLAVKEQDKKQAHSDENALLNKVESIVCITFILTFALLTAIFVVFEISHRGLVPFNQNYDKKAQLYTDLAYTQVYFLNFAIGENRLENMQLYWSQNQKYPDIVSVFNSINQQAFSHRFQEYVHQFRSELAYDQLTKKIEQLTSKTEYVLKVSELMIWCCLFLVVANFAASIIIFVRNQSASNKILSSFLRFQSQEIQTNLDRLQGLQKLLQIQQFKPQLINQYENSKDKDMSFNMSRIESIFEKRKKRRMRVSSREQRKENLEMMFNLYFENSVDKDADSSILILKKEMKLDMQGIKTKLGKKQKQAEPEPELEQQPKQISLMSSLHKNKASFIPTTISLILKVMAALTTLFFIQQLMINTIKCITLKHQLLYEPVIAISMLEAQYFSDSDSRYTRDYLVQYEYKIQQLLKQLPLQLKQFLLFQASIKQNNQSICEKLDKESNLGLYNQCKSQPSIFKSGMQSILSFIQQKFRLVNSDQLPKTYLQQSNQLSLAYKVCLKILENRNNLYLNSYLSYYNKYDDIKNLIRSLLIVLFVFCLYLQIRELTFNEQRVRRTQNLFKIVPQFMRDVAGGKGIESFGLDQSK